MLTETQRPARSDLATVGPPGSKARFEAFLQCFNSGRYFEAHDVLEQTWLPARGGNEARFYQGLIQVAGAFVHLQKRRWQPALSLLRLARVKLRAYPTWHQGLDLGAVVALIDRWSNRLEHGEQPRPGEGAEGLPRLGGPIGQAK